MSDEPVRVMPYDAQWPAMFDAEVRLLAEALAGFVVGGIHYVGSTSAPASSS